MNFEKIHILYRILAKNRSRSPFTQRSDFLKYALIFILLFLIAPMGYMWVEGWTFFDAFYMTFITLATIGYGEVHPLHPLGRLWAIIIAFLGIGMGGYIFTRSVEYMLGKTQLFERRMKHAIEALSDHTIICGFGRIGERVAQGLQEAEHPFVVIELSEERAARMQTAGYLYILGNAEEEETLDKAGILRAKKLVLALEQDRDNAFLALMARGMNPNLFILARTDYATPHNRSLLTRAGADKVISPYEIGATRMTQLLTRPLVHSFMEELDTFRNLKVEMDEMLVGPDARFNGKSLAMLNIRQAFGAIIIAIHDPIKNETLFNPDAQTIIEAGQTLIVMGVGNQLRDLARACQN